ncbi:MAG: radical SAM protein [Pseudomonadota bacterium]
MKWSRHNLLFRSDKFGLMLYNSLTNRLMTFAPDFEPELDKIREDPAGYDFSGCFGVFTGMMANRVLVDEQAEQDILNAMKMRKLASRFDASEMALTLMVTEDCNFGCPYCYEKNKRRVDMSPETCDRLVEFVRGAAPRKLFVNWFGGEPLMRFDTMLALNERFLSLGMEYSSFIVTNGWLLNEEVTARLAELSVTGIQVTIEGPAEIHDQKRFHLEQGGSHDVIRDNLDRLMLQEKWPGKLFIHYNVDEANADVLAQTHDHWTERYKGSNVGFGVSFVDRNERGSRDMGCSFDKEQEIAFYLEHYKRHGGKGLRYFPRHHQVGCCATKLLGFVVGAEGQMYKCWDDVGKKEMEVGSLYKDPREWDQPLMARYMVGVEPFDDPACRQCFYLPVCEECPNIWYRRKYLGQKIKTCANYKHHLPEYLEIHHELQGNRPPGAGEPEKP